LAPSSASVSLHDLLRHRHQRAEPASHGLNAGREAGQPIVEVIAVRDNEPEIVAQVEQRHSGRVEELDDGIVAAEHLDQHRFEGHQHTGEGARALTD
jgi:hypothetical protein